MMQHLPNQPVVVTVASPSYGRRENYSGKQALGLGAFQLILGGASFICQIAAIASGDPYSFTGAGIWGGILMMIAGGLGIGAARRKANCLIVAVMVMSIIASISTTVIIGFAAASLGGRDFSWGYRDEYIPGTFVTRQNCVARRCYYASFPFYTTGSCITKRDTQCELRVVMNSILILCAVAELVIAIWASALCCSVTCCGSRPLTSKVVAPLQQTRGQVPVFPGPASQICQITSTGGLFALPNIQYTASGQVVVLQQPAPSGNTFLPSYAQVTTQQQRVPNYGQAAFYQQPAPGYTHSTNLPLTETTLR